MMDSELTFEILDCPNFEQLEKARILRTEVFVTELGYELDNEMDDYDTKGWHLLVRKNGELIGNSRVIKKKCGNQYLSRVLIKEEHRGKGYSVQMLNFLIQECLKRGYDDIYVESMVYVVGLYERVGFEKEGPLMVVEGEDHYKMHKRLN